MNRGVPKKAEALQNTAVTRFVDGRLFITTAGLCAAFGIVQSATAKWRAAGCPQAERGWWDLRAVMEWREKRYLDNADFDAEELARRQTLAETVYREERARRQKLEADALEEKLLTREDVAQAWASRVAEVRSALASLPRRVARDLLGRTEAEIRARLAEEVREICGGYARGGTFTPEGGATGGRA